jgi:glycosyltransferase involved in cell wall biosynthesis
MTKPTLLLFCPVYSTLIKKEVEMFSEEYDVKIFDLQSTKKIGIPFRILLQFFFLVKNISRTKIMVSRFVGYQTILPILFSKITSKPVVCIMGGLECIKFPSVNTGSYIRPFFGAVTKWCLKNATHLCPVHDSLILTDYTYQDDDYPKQGYKYFVPECNTPATVIRNGYDPEKWQRTAEKIPNSFITVAHGIEQDHLYRLKGIDLIIAIAGSFPECTFTIAGGKKEMLHVSAPVNVHFAGEVANEKLHDLLSSKEFYLQLSITEGFPNALCEAMLCECIPVGSDVGAIPEIIGNERFILKRKDAGQLAKIISDALMCDRKNESEKARKRIKENYTLEKRRNSFFQLFHHLIKK